MKPTHSDIAALVQHLFTAPFVTDLGMTLDEFAPGRCTSLLELAPRHRQQDGYVHAGVMATLADHTAGFAAVSLVGGGETVLTAEFKIHLRRVATTCAASVRC